jgi:hypothetical protein
VRPITPAAEIEPFHPVTQIIPKWDVTRGRDPEAAADLLRGLLDDLPKYQRGGLLTHKPLLDGNAKQGKAKFLDLLGDPYRRRLAKVSYFGSGLARGSNEWIAECDVLLVFGTPRVGPEAIREHLLRIGEPLSARRRRAEVCWRWDSWSGVTESGQRQTIGTPHYTDHAWHAAYRYIVVAELRQAIGRARGILREGIPCYVVTTENLAPAGDGIDGRNGPPISEWPFAPLTEEQATVLAELRRSSTARKPRELARSLGMNERRVKDLLRDLHAARRARHVGVRGGWRAAS